MIRYAISKAKLEAAIEAEKPGWLAKAKQKTDAFRKAKDFNEPAAQNSWSDIKGVYMKLQHNKCAYCERVLGSPQFGKIEHDVEHFRPKNAVKAWPTAKMKTSRGLNYTFSTGDASDNGYYLLAYNILNYTTACKICNTSFKSNYFPIAGARNISSSDFRKVKQEAAFLLYPLGTSDEDPEQLITFEGVLPVPKIKTGVAYQRARITIDFFGLTRDELLQRRAQILQHLWLAFLNLEDQQTNAQKKQLAQRIIDLGTSAKSEQSACARAFFQLCQRDRTLAEVYVEQAAQYLNSLPNN